MRPRTLIIALVASAALNFFLLAGAVTVFALHHGGGETPSSTRWALRHAARSLEGRHRGAFIALLRGEGASARAAGRQAHALRQQAWSSLEAPVFDPAAAKARLAQARQINQRTRGQVEEAVVDFAATLPASERARLGAAMAAR